MNSLTAYARTQVLDFLLTAETVARPAALWVALHDADPGREGATGEIVVGTDPDYARQPIEFATPAWSIDRAVALSSIAATWTPATGVSYTVVGLSLWDAATSGNCIAAVKLLVGLTISDISPLTIAAGKLPVILSGLAVDGGLLALKWLLTDEVVVRPTAWFAALHDADPGPDGSGSEIDTGMDPDYARQPIEFAAATEAGGGEVVSPNSLAIEWIPGAGADYDYTHRSIRTAISGGICLATAPLLQTVHASEGIPTGAAVGDDAVAMY